MCHCPENLKSWSSSSRTPQSCNLSVKIGASTNSSSYKNYASSSSSWSHAWLGSQKISLLFDGQGKLLASTKDFTGSSWIILSRPGLYRTSDKTASIFREFRDPWFDNRILCLPPALQEHIFRAPTVQYFACNLKTATMYVYCTGYFFDIMCVDLNVCSRNRCSISILSKMVVDHIA